MQKKVITAENIISKYHTQANGYNYNATFNPNDNTLRIYGSYNSRKVPMLFDRTFKIGDVVEYGSYNLSYMGTIIKFSAKVVEVNVNGTYPQYKDKTPKIKRLKLYDFINRNWDFDLEKKCAENLETMMYI